MAAFRSRACTQSPTLRLTLTLGRPSGAHWARYRHASARVFARLIVGARSALLGRSLSPAARCSSGTCSGSGRLRGGRATQ